MEWNGSKRLETARSRRIPRSDTVFMRGLNYHFNNLRFRHLQKINDFSIPISSVFLCLKRWRRSPTSRHGTWCPMSGTSYVGYDVTYSSVSYYDIYIYIYIYMSLSISLSLSVSLSIIYIYIYIYILCAYISIQTNK